MIDIAEKIDEVAGEVSIETFDMTFGEIVNLHEGKELIIQPEYQRLFRWTDEQKSRLIESILLKLPIPQIFVIERSDSVLELIDGLQRVSSVIQFMNPSVLTLDSKPLDALVLQGCDLVPELNNYTFEKLPLTLRLTIKRSSVRMVIIKKKSKSFLRYAMFKRLNTGGAILSPQEIRNCSARMVGEDGVKFYEFLIEQSQHYSFQNCIKKLSQTARDKKGEEELILRFLASKNAPNLFRKGSVTEWLDVYMDKIILKEIDFDYDSERKIFHQLFVFLDRTIGDGAFVKYRGKTPTGGLAPAYYEAITVGTLNALEKIQHFPSSEVKQKIIDTVQTKTFRSYTGSGANKLDKLQGRIKTIENALLELINNE